MQSSISSRPSETCTKSDKTSSVQSYPIRKPREESFTSVLQTTFSNFSKDVLGLPPYQLALLSLSTGSLLTYGAIRYHRRYHVRISTADSVTPEVLNKKKWVKGRVTSVGDADNFRFYHTPGWGWGWLRRIPNAAKDLKNETIHIRIAGVDAPEAAHFGRPKQPYSEEALQWLKSTIEGRKIKVMFLSKDQYKRVVAAPKYKRRFLGFLLPYRSLSIEMIRSGWSRVYESAGAEYYPYTLEKFKREENKARRKKKGIWSDRNAGMLESPAEYKRRMKDLDAGGAMAGGSNSSGKKSAGTRHAEWLSDAFDLKKK